MSHPSIAPSRRAGNIASLSAGLLGGFVVALSLPVVVQGWGLPGGVANGIGIMTAMVGTYLALIGCLLMARLPWVEREIGQDRLTAWHRNVGPWALILIVAHLVFTTLGYAQAVNMGFVSEFLDIVLNTAWMLPALTGAVIMIALGAISWRRIRNMMKYETWLTAHQFFYLAIALAFGHQIESGSVFMGAPVAEAFWIALYIAVFGALVVWRILVPLARSLRHRARVERVERISHDTVHVYVSGRRIEKLGAQGGQWFTWRFGTRAWWWQGHPYSLSAKPTDTGMRITVKNLGDQSSELETLKPGTRVWFEGPYGAFRADRRHADSVTLMGAGIGITPVRALLEEMPAHVHTTVVYRTREDNDPLAAELGDLVAARGHGNTLVTLVGSRTEHPITPEYLHGYIPNVAHGDVFVCGPTAFIDEVKSSVRVLGVPAGRVHDELFEF